MKYRESIFTKDFIFKIMFAVEIAMLPLIISARILMPEWAMSIFVGLIIISKLFMVILKDPANTKQLYIDAIGSVVTVGFCLIAYCCYGYISVPFAVISTVLFALEELSKIYFYYKPNNQIIDSLYFAVEMFMFIIFASLLVVFYNDIMISVAMLALCITCGILVAVQGYKFIYYYVIKKDNKKKY